MRIISFVTNLRHMQLTDSRRFSDTRLSHVVIEVPSKDGFPTHVTTSTHANTNIGPVPFHTAYWVELFGTVVLNYISVNISYCIIASSSAFGTTDVPENIRV